MLGCLRVHTSILHEITLVCTCRLRMCLYVTMTLNNNYMSNYFNLISLRRLNFDPTYICYIGIE